MDAESMNLRGFVNLLDEKGLLVRIGKEVDAKYEVSTVMKMLDGKPLLFERVGGFSMPVVANVCSTRQLVAMGLGCREDDIIQKLAGAIEMPAEPETLSAKGYSELECDLGKLPILTHYQFDRAPYISSGIVIAQDSEYGLNASYHRMMVISKDRVVMRILERDFHKYLERGLKEFAVCIGNSIPVLLAAAISAGTEVNELAIANALKRTPVMEIMGHKVPHSEIVMVAEVTGEMHDEGPFLDLTETADIVRKQRVARIKHIFARKDSLYHALLPGGLEHKVLMGMPREPTIFREVSKVCECKDVYITPGGCSWLHAAISIRKKDPEDGRKAIEAAFKGHRSVKHVFVVDEDIDIHNPQELEWAMATRFQGDKDMIMKKEKGSSLDPSSDMATRMTTKIGFDMTIPAGSPKDFKRPALPMKIRTEDYVR
ncbi:MAG: UbiD family decarboxylase [Candidatus Thermoplasmatota archaeon]